MPVREQQDADHEPARLSPMQASCLRWAAGGKTMNEAATIEGISVSIVALHLRNARRILGAADIAQAIAIATRRQLI